MKKKQHKKHSCTSYPKAVRARSGSVEQVVTVFLQTSMEEVLKVVGLRILRTGGRSLGS